MTIATEIGYVQKCMDAWTGAKERMFQKVVDELTPDATDEEIASRYQLRVFRTPFYEELWFDGEPILRIVGEYKDEKFTITPRLLILDDLEEEL